MSSPRSGFALRSAVVAGLMLSAVPLAWSSGRHAAQGALAQRLVESIVAHHSEVREAGIVAETAHGCFNVASTDRGDLGERCESDDSAPLKTGTASVGKEEGGYAVSLPLQDQAGSQVAALGIEFRRGAFSTQDAALARAKSIEAELEPQILSKAVLLAPLASGKSR